MGKGKLYLLPTAISEDNLSQQIPQGHLDILMNIDEFAVENLRTARRYLRSIGYQNDFDKIVFHLFDKNALSSDIESITASILSGKNIALVSEAGLPCIADPGSLLVAKAHEKKISVVPLSGPSSIFLALMASGFNGQSFSFHGYLPIDKGELMKKLKKIEEEAYRSGYTQIFMETPYRNEQLLEFLITNCKESTQLAIACDLLSKNQKMQMMPIHKWKKSNKIAIHKKPCIFCLSR